MKRIGLIHAKVFFLMLGIVGSVEARQNKPERQDEKAKAEKKDERAKPSNQEKQQANRQESQQHQNRADSENQSRRNAAKQQDQAKKQQEHHQQGAAKQQEQQRDDSNKRQQQIAKGQEDQQRHQQQEQQNNSRNQQQQAREQQSQKSGSSKQHSSAQAHQQQVAFQNNRAHSWQSEHRTWQQRGGYSGYRVPDDRFRQYYGEDHAFRIYSLPVVFIGGGQRFQYGGYWFGLIDPWPEYWSSDWYDSDDVYVNYDEDGYYLYNRRYRNDRVAISFYLN
ncbi:MAG TPA: hypothetical protein VIW23_04470 [Candidatus Acidoferrum sp.]|jgi:hypothetical protein